MSQRNDFNNAKVDGERLDIIPYLEYPTFTLTKTKVEVPFTRPGAKLFSKAKVMEGTTENDKQQIMFG